MTRVAVVGVGRMGRPMARHIAAAGFDLAVFDADREAAAVVAAECGARLWEQASDFADTDVVITMLPTSAVVSSVLFDGGVVAALPTGATIVDMSSSNPSDTIASAQRASDAGVVLVDAPVSGGVSGAEAGSLAIMLGGDDEATAPVMPVLEAMSRAVFRTGPVGSAHAMKALNNVVAGATTIACFEALAAGRHYGLDPATMVEIWNGSTARSFVSEVVMARHVVPGTFDTGFALPLYAKDVGVARDLVVAAGVEAPLVRTVAASFSDALAQLGDVDHTRIFDLRDPRHGAAGSQRKGESA